MQRRVQSSLQSMPVINGWCIAELTAVIYLNENDHNDEKVDDEIFSNSIRRSSKHNFYVIDKTGQIEFSIRI